MKQPLSAGVLIKAHHATTGNLREMFPDPLMFGTIAAASIYERRRFDDEDNDLAAARRGLLDRVRDACSRDLIGDLPCVL